MNYSIPSIYNSNNIYPKNSDRWGHPQMYHHDNPNRIERARLSAHFLHDTNDYYGGKERSSFSSIRKSVSGTGSRSFKPRISLDYDYSSTYPVNSYGPQHAYNNHYNSAYPPPFSKSRPPSSRTSSSSFFMDSVRDQEKKNILVEKDRITTQMNHNTNTNNNLKGIFSYSDDSRNTSAKQALTRPTSKTIPRNHTPTPGKGWTNSPRSNHKENLSPKVKGLQEVNEPLHEFPESRYDERFTEPKNLPFEETKQEADRLTKEEKKTLKLALERNKRHKQSKLAEIRASGERSTVYKDYDEVFYASASESEDQSTSGDFVAGRIKQEISDENVEHKIPDIEEEDESDVEYFDTFNELNENNDELNESNDELNESNDELNESNDELYENNDEFSEDGDDENEIELDDEDDDIHIESESEDEKEEDYTDIDFCVNETEDLNCKSYTSEDAERLMLNRKN